MKLPFEFLHFTEIEALNVGAYVLGIFIIAFILLKILRAILNKFIKSSSDEMRVDPTQYKFLSNALGFIIYTIALIIIFMSIDKLKEFGIALFASAGILAAIIGFASQAAFSNIVSGVFIVIFKPFRVGDIVKIGASAGVVEDITLRHTVIKDFENKRLVIPNSAISSDTILSYNIVEDKVCNHIFYGISYDSNIDLAIKIIQEEAMAHEHFIDYRSDDDIAKGIPSVIVRFLEYGESSINLRAQVWSEDPIKGFELKCDINKSIKERFDREGIEIPFPYRTIVYKEAKKES